MDCKYGKNLPLAFESPPGSFMKAPLELSATMLAGLGLFFVGVALVKGNLKNIASRKFRGLVTRMSGNVLGAASWGIFSGLLTQSGRTTSYIMASFVHTGLLGVRRALPVVIWANLGCALLVFAAVLPLETLILILVGCTGMLWAFEVPQHYRYVYGTAFGLALLLFGLNLVKVGAGGYVAYPWFQSLVRVMRDSDMLAFLAGLLLTLVAQSHMAIILIAIAMSTTGLLHTEEMLMIVYGTHAGSGLITWFLGVNFRGSAKQVVMAQVCYNLAGVGVFLFLYYVEVWAGIPLVLALLQKMSRTVGGQAVWGTILFNVVMPLLLTVGVRAFHRWIEEYWPVSARESLGHTEYLDDFAIDQPDAAVLLAEKEQLRLLQRMPHYLEPLRNAQANGKVSPDRYHAAFADISPRIRAYLAEVMNRSPGAETLEWLLNVQNRQDLLASVDEDLLDLVKSLQGRAMGEKVMELAMSIVESLHIILLTTVAASETADPDEYQMLDTMTADRGGVMERIRKAYLAEEHQLPAEDRALIYHITNLFERLGWTLGRHARLLGQTARPQNEQVKDKRTQRLASPQELPFQ